MAKGDDFIDKLKWPVIAIACIGLVYLASKGFKVGRYSNYDGGTSGSDLDLANRLYTASNSRVSAQEIYRLTASIANLSKNDFQGVMQIWLAREAKNFDNTGLVKLSFGNAAIKKLVEEIYKRSS